MPVSARGFVLFTQQDIGQFRKGLNFITNDIFLVTEHIPLTKMIIGTTSTANVC